MDAEISTLRAFADETRIRILHLVRNEEHCVAELVETLGLSQPLVSKHLAQLRNVGLVEHRSDGPWRYYRLATPQSKLHRRLTNGILDDLGDLELLREDSRRMKEVMTYLKCCLPEDGGCQGPARSYRPRRGD